MHSYPLQHILFLDIETVPQYQNYDAVPEDWKELWNTKSNSLLKNDTQITAADIYNRAGIYAEFGKIICISCGVIQIVNHQEKKIIIKSFFGDDEKELLIEFCNMLTKWSANKKDSFLCAHNGKEFDYPYICRKLIIHQIPIPTILNISGKKPWEINHLDTMELWKFGDYKNYTSLNLLAHTLGIPTPKDDIDGSKVYEVYYQEKNIERIVTYCQKDVITTIQVFLRQIGETIVSENAIEIK